MVIVYRWPDDKPKRPKAPVETHHFAANWHVRTGTPLSTFRKRWKSAQFLGGTELSRYGHKPGDKYRTGRVLYYGLTGAWVVLLTGPQASRATVLSVWPRAWFDEQWAIAVTNSEMQAQAAQQHADGGQFESTPPTPARDPVHAV